jgi:small subunit ribosomal protein S16
MVRIRLKRQGRKHRPFYRIVVTDIRSRRDGAPLTELGYYNPISKELKLDKKSALEWISKGAQPSETAQRLIDKADENGALIVLQVAKKQRLSRKAAEKAKAEAAAAEA